MVSFRISMNWKLVLRHGKSPKILANLERGIAPREVVASKDGLRRSNGDALDSQHAYTELEP